MRDTRRGMKDHPGNTDASAPAGRQIAVHIVAWAVLLVVAAALFARSYQRWGHPIIDLGRDLYLPAQLLQGRVLYRDLLYNYGPLAPYLLAAVTWLFGPALWVFAGVGLATIAATAAALYAIGHRLRGVGAGFACALAFLVLNAFANLSWGCNFVLPYAYAATLGMTFALWSFYLLLRHLAGGRRLGTFIGSVALMALAGLCKQEIGLAIGLVHVAAWWLHRVPWRRVAGTVGVGLGLCGLFVWAFAARGPAEHALFGENLMKFRGEGLVQSFFLDAAGLDDIAESLSELLVPAPGLLLGYAGLRLLVAARVARVKGLVRAAPKLQVLGALVFVVGLVVAGDVRVFGLCVAAAPIAIARLWRKDRRDPLLLLAVFVLGTAVRIPLRYHPLWYGFVLSIPAYPFAAALALRKRRHMPPGAVKGALALLLLAMLLRTGAEIWEGYGYATVTLRTPMGTLRDAAADTPNGRGRAEVLRSFLAWWEDRHAETPPASLVVFPEGVSLNYFLGVPNPTGCYLFTPPEIPTPAAERRVLPALRAAAPERIVINSRDTWEFGSKGFGADYAREIMAWIDANYVIERAFEPPPGGAWRLVVLRKRLPGLGLGIGEYGYPLDSTTP